MDHVLWVRLSEPLWRQFTTEATALDRKYSEHLREILRERYRDTKGE